MRLSYVIGLCGLFAAVGLVAASGMAGFFDKVPAEYAGFERKVGGACGFDPIKVDGDGVTVSGWGVVAAADGVVSEAMLVAAGGSGAAVFVKADKTRRDDVVSFFKSPRLADSGFHVHLAGTTAPGTELRLFQVFGKQLIECPVKGQL